MSYVTAAATRAEGLVTYPGNILEISIFIWGKPTAGSQGNGAGSLMSFEPYDLQSTRRIRMYVDGAGLVYGQANGAGGASATSTVAYTDGEWNPFLLRGDDAVPRLRIDTGLGNAENTTDSWGNAGVGNSKLTLHGLAAASSNRYHGKTAYAAVWDSYLSDANAALLLAGTPPEDIVPAPSFWLEELDDLDNNLAETLTEIGTAGTFDAADRPPVGGAAGFNITSVGGDDAMYPGETGVPIVLDSSASPTSCNLDDGVSTPEVQTITTGGPGTTIEITASLADLPYTKDHDGNQLGARTPHTLTLSE